MTGDTSQPTIERLTWPELLVTLLDERGELKMTDGTRVVPCPFSEVKKICRMRKVAVDKFPQNFYCVETLVVINEAGRAMEADTGDYCPSAVAANAF